MLSLKCTNVELGTDCFYISDGERDVNSVFYASEKKKWSRVEKRYSSTTLKKFIVRKSVLSKYKIFARPYFTR